MKKTTLNIAILCSGGDAPGMNAAIRSAVITAIENGHKVIGYLHGYNGLIKRASISLDYHATHNIIQLGGTIIKSARCPEMETRQGILTAVRTLVDDAIDALIVIGGDGSFHGLMALSEHWNGQLIGLPGTIDNDISGSDYTIGFSTAIETALDAIDKIRDTADAFDRIFIIELMGKHSGHITFHVGLASAAESVLSFENTNSGDVNQILNTLANDIQRHQKNNPGSYLICIAENLWPNGSLRLVDDLKALNIDATLCILGHIQRGGSPCAQDRILATNLGFHAISVIERGQTEIMVGEINNQIAITSIKDVLELNKPISATILETYKNSHKI